MYFAFCGNVQDRSKDTPGPQSQHAPRKESRAGEGAASGEGPASGRGQLGIRPTLRHPHSGPHPGLYQTSPQRAQDQGWGICSWICARSFRLSTGCFWPRCLLCSPQAPWVLRETALTSRSAQLQAWRTRSRCWDSPSLSATGQLWAGTPELPLTGAEELSPEARQSHHKQGQPDPGPQGDSLHLHESHTQALPGALEAQMQGPPWGERSLTPSGWSDPIWAE